VTRLASAEGLPEPRVRARVTGRGTARTLAYRIEPAAGQKVTFVERGARTYRVLGEARGRSGRLRFTPADGRPGTRRIEALVERGGVQTATVAVARYTAPAARRPARPRGLRVTRRGGRLVARWRPVAGAARYAVVVEAAGRPRTLRLTRRTRLRVAVPSRGRATVLVGALARDGREGRQVRRRLR